MYPQYENKIPFKAKFKAALTGLITGIISWIILRVFSVEITVFLLLYFNADLGQVLVLKILFSATAAYTAYRIAMRSVRSERKNSYSKSNYKRY